MRVEVGRVNILVVDDRPEQLMSLEAVLAPLGENVVKASSGREALRSLLQEEFAVILLDINMPEIDGFETATLIRKRRSTRHTPIIFLTAHTDRVYVERSYSLGAVDYIMTPFAPEVLRTKVSVFVDLFRKTQKIRLQAESLRARAEQLQRLNRAALAINSALSLDAMTAAITDAARDVSCAHQAMTLVKLERPGERARTAASYSERYATFQHESPPPIAGRLCAFVCGRNRPLRMTQRELSQHPEWLDDGGQHPPPRGYLAVPLTAADGRNMGAIQLSDRHDGEFSDDDETVLVQLAQLAAIAIQNCVHAEAREANRMKDEFLATLSHELRSPLNAILGWTHLLRGEPFDEQRVSHGLEVIERNAAAQAKLIEDLLDVSRITAGKLRISAAPMALAPVVETAVDAIRPGAEARGLTVDVALDPAVEVNGDADRLQQVVSNLLSNALKFTRPEGHIHVSLRRAGASAELSVRDTGEGIAPDFLPFLFERFRQADSTSRRKHAGLGIGLSLVRDIVEAHGGSVVAESAGLQQGSTFVVRIPLLGAERRLSVAPLREARSRPLAACDAASDLGGLHVLLVEDDADARELLQEVLSQHRAEVTAVASVREALAAFGAARPHVLVSDIAMPGEDGYELIRTIRQHPPQAGGDLPALALTAYARKEDQKRALDAGFHMHATKPIEPAALVAAVAHLAARARAGELSGARERGSSEDIAR
ncbi:histidine kinase [Sorangium cellulosum]|uniref:histidine kinase n=1 Tax=Sorangium cellulosum TaxID=56 RepID=A0A2L0ELR3_SORCE|nr:response regulator [Sorangium cellulosum]AUX40238.1 histidine kinase [Sorangium cellulosum]